MRSLYYDKYIYIIYIYYIYIKLTLGAIESLSFLVIPTAFILNLFL